MSLFFFSEPWSDQLISSVLQFLPHGMQAWNRILTHLPCENYPSSALNPETATDTQWSVYIQTQTAHRLSCVSLQWVIYMVRRNVDMLLQKKLWPAGCYNESIPCRGNSSLLLLSEASLSQSTVWTELHCHKDRCSSTTSCNSTCTHFRFNFHLRHFIHCLFN